MKASRAELALARDLLDSDFRMVQRDGLVAARADGVAWMLTFAGLAADDGFESVRVEADTRWRRPVEEVRTAIADRGAAIDGERAAADGKRGDAADGKRGDAADGKRGDAVGAQTDDATDTESAGGHPDDA